MPELPEVETIVRYLRPRLSGKRIIKVVTDTPRLFRDYKNPAEVIRKIEGTTIRDVSRRGKNIVFHISGGKYFLMHLMMSGRLRLNPRDVSPYDRITFFLSGKNKLVFNDPRKFGRCRLTDSLEGIAGREPFAISFADFKQALFNRKGVIKPLLLNQNILAGIGNIYADEMLWLAGIHPLRKASDIAETEQRALWNSMRKILAKGIATGGSSMRYFQSPNGNAGGYYDIRKVYRRTGEKCSRDGAIFQRIIVGQRSTHFCPKHQR
jgi:formamidopyrimidine-DNA glycosylase